MRVLGIDFGERRIGLAISDESATLARPLRTVPRGASDSQLVADLASEIDRLNRQDGVGSIVLGLPLRLDGTATDLTGRVRALARALADRTGMPVVLQDERLTSHEADERLAFGERDWRKRKRKLDAAAAAVILQDYLDERRQR